MPSFAGLKSGFTILDTDDVVRLIKQIIQAEGLDDKRWAPRTFAMMIDGWKNKGFGPSDIPEGDARSFANGKGRQLYQAYQDRLLTLNACDFGDLLLHPIRIFRQHHDVLAEYHRKFKYILVDEYQDTNTAQYMWLRLLAQRPKVGGTQTAEGRARDRAPGDVSPAPAEASERSERSAVSESKQQQINICCVGDDDQSIYGWRGAEVDNILRFDKDFPGATVIRLERNYRSTAHILGAASHLIAHNEGPPRQDAVHRTVADRTTTRSMSTPPGIRKRKPAPSARRSSSSSATATSSTTWRSWCAPPSRCASSKTASSRSASTTASSAARASTSGWRSAMRWPIFRVVAQGADDLAFERIVNVPKRGLGDATIRQIHDTARALAHPDAGGSKQPRRERRAEAEAARRAARGRRQFRALAEGCWTHTPHTELAEIILEESGYTDMWKNDRSAEAPGRLENLKELIRSMEEYESLRCFLEHVALVMDAEQNAELDAVTIMTLHSAKGLEFETVFLPGWEEGLFPHQRSLDEGGRSGLEEERRLAYVGLTRAKKNLHIWFVSNRRIHGLWQSTIPSRFLDELPEAHVEVAGRRQFLWRLRQCLRRRFVRLGPWRPPEPYGASRFDNLGADKSGGSFSNTYATPGWQRAQQNRTEATDRNWGTRSGHAVERIGYGETDSGYGAGRGSIKARTIDGELVAKSVSDRTLAIQRRRPGVPPEIRQRQYRGDRRQQADHRLRQGRAEEGAGRVRDGGVRIPRGNFST